MITGEFAEIVMGLKSSKDPIPLPPLNYNQIAREFVADVQLCLGFHKSTDVPSVPDEPLSEVAFWEFITSAIKLSVMNVEVQFNLNDSTKSVVKGVMPQGKYHLVFFVKRQNFTGIDLHRRIIRIWQERQRNLDRELVKRW